MSADPEVSKRRPVGLHPPLGFVPPEWFTGGEYGSLFCFYHKQICRQNVDTLLLALHPNYRSPFVKHDQVDEDKDDQVIDDVGDIDMDLNLLFDDDEQPIIQEEDEEVILAITYMLINVMKYTCLFVLIKVVLFIS